LAAINTALIRMALLLTDKTSQGLISDVHTF
jgi:hypothetical protein